MRRSRSLATKLVLAMAPIVALAIVALTSVAVTRASDAQRTSVQRGLQDLAARHANAIDATAAGNAEIARSMAAQMTTLEQGGRPMVKELVHGIALRHPELNGLYVEFDHNQYGPDAPYAGQETKSGLFAPYWYRDKGKLRYSPSDGDMAGQDWWEVPKATLRDAVIDPYVDITIHVMIGLVRLADPRPRPLPRRGGRRRRAVGRAEHRAAAPRARQRLQLPGHRRRQVRLGARPPSDRQGHARQAAPRRSRPAAAGDQGRARRPDDRPRPVRR